MEKKKIVRSGNDVAALAMLVWTVASSLSCGKPTPPPTVLEGEWLGPCLVDPDGRSFQVHLYFGGSVMTRVAMNFSDPNCHMLSSASKILGEFRLGGGVAAAPGARAMDLLYRCSSATPATSYSAGQFNEVALCGFRDWLVNNEKDVTGALCGSDRFPPANTVEYGIVQSEGNSLRLGVPSEAGTGRTEASRYVTFDTLVYTHED